MDPQAEGTLELSEKGWGFLRSAKRNYAVHPTDPFVSANMIRQWTLRGGENLAGVTQRSNGRGNGEPTSQLTLRQLDSVNRLDAGDYSQLTNFDDLITIDPQQQIQ